MDNYSKAVFFKHPDYIPVNFHINAACWHHYEKEWLWDLMEEHPGLFPDFTRPASDWEPDYPLVARKEAPYRDPMGCVWVTSDDGITGTVKGHPLESWEAWGKTWDIPDPETTDGLYTVDWEKQEKAWATIRKEGGSLVTGLRHGHTFLQLSDLRGYENLLMDMADEEPRLEKLIEVLTDFNLTLVKKFIKAGSTLMCYPEDLGMQVGPMLSPMYFKRYIKPAYRRLMQPAIEAGIAVQMHSDGDIRMLADDLIESGVQSINLQDLVNGIEWIAERFRGKVCVDLDIDRQRITPFGTPKDIEELIREEVEKIATPAGGLALTFGLYPGTPTENVKALMDTLEKYMYIYD